MSARRSRLIVAIGLVLGVTGNALAQTRVTVYPILAWLPLSISIDVNLPPVDVGGGGGGILAGKIVDGRFDGAYFGGLSVDVGPWRIEGDGMWAAVGGDRPERPTLVVDVDAIYGHASLGRKVVGDLYVTGGVRRLATKYTIKLDNRVFERKPGFWDPLIGVAYHKVGDKFAFHAALEGGGFGVGTDSEFATAIRAEWKPLRHFGLTAGYSLLTFKLSHDVANKTFVAKQTLHGPTAGIALYF